MLGAHQLFFLLLTTLAAAQNTTTTFPSSLSFVPACARDCINAFIPTLVSSFSETCRIFPSANPALNGTTPAENVRQQIAACVWECDEETNMSPAFRAQLAEVCNDADDAKRGLSPGAIAGIVIGVVCGLGLVVVAAVVFLRYRRQSSEESSERGLGSHTPSSSAASFASSADVEKGQKWTPATSSTTSSPPIDTGGFDFGLSTSPPAPAPAPASPQGQTFMAITTETTPTHEGWSPVSPVTAPFPREPQYLEPQPQRRNSRVLLPKSSSPPPPPAQMYTQPIEEAQGGYFYPPSPVSVESSPPPPPQIPSPPPQLTTAIPLSRADSISWRRELQEAAERAATRVSLQVSRPILEDDSSMGVAERRNGERRASRGSILSLGLGKGARRTSFGGR